MSVESGQIPAETQVSYDGQGRPTSSVFYSNGAAQWQTTTAYPGADETDVTPPTGGTPTAAITDARGQQTQLRQFHGATPTGAYDITRYGYDAAGRQTSIIGPLAQSADPSTSKLHWTSRYDAQGNIVSSSDPDSGTSTSTFDDVGQQISTTDAAGQTITTDYDLLGRPTGTHNGDASGPLLTSLTYDTATLGKGFGATATAYAADGTTPTWTSSTSAYTISGQPVDQNVTIPAGAYGNTQAITYSTHTTYTSVLGNVYSTEMKETGTGGLISDETEHFAYNAMGLPASSGGIDSYETNTNYDPHGRVIRATSGVTPNHIATTNNWDEPTGRLLDTTVSAQSGDNSATAVDTYDYTYDPSGKITSSTDTRDGGGTENVDRQCYRYDHLGRLTDVWTDAGGVTTAPTPSVQNVGSCDTTDPTTASFSGPAPYWHSYAYDLTGNRTTATDHAVAGGAMSTTTTTENFDTPNAAHAVHTAATSVNGTASGKQTWTYDSNGRPTGIDNTGGTQAGSTQTLAWTPTGHLANLSTAKSGNPTHDTSYGYDATRRARVPYR